MSKSMVIRLFVGAVLAMVVGLLIAFAALVAAFAGGAVTIGGPTVVTVNGPAFAGTVVWLVVGGLAIAGASLAAIASWIGALLNTVQLEDKTWFLAVLILGLISLGWVAMVAYVFAGPDATRQDMTRPALARTSGT
jgi:hypothetical protein